MSGPEERVVPVHQLPYIPFTLHQMADAQEVVSNGAHPSGDSAVDASPTNKRYGKSLSSLTRKFVALLKNSNAGVLDLKEVSTF